MTQSMSASLSPASPVAPSSPPPSPSTPFREGLPISTSSSTAAAESSSRRQLFQSAPASPNMLRSNWASGSLDDSSEGALYHSAEPSAAAAHALPRRSSSKIIDFALAQRASTSSAASGFGGTACPLLSTSFDSEFDLNTELMAHKGAFRDALTLRDEQLLLRLKQKQRELKQMEAALIKKHEEYHLLKVLPLLSL